MRLALGVAYRGQAYRGWQSQPDGTTVQDRLEAALASFAAHPVRTHCAGRTDAGVHALNQVVHLDTELDREPFAWVRGSNRFLPSDIAVQWCRPVDTDFHARFHAVGRRYAYVVRESPVRPALEAGLASWTFRPLDAAAMRLAAEAMIGTHDFSSFRSAECQAASPVKSVRSIGIARRGLYWRFDFDADAYLHHMVRNLMGGLLAVGSGARPAAWLAEVLAARDRRVAAPTAAADGLYFVGPYYDAARHDIPAPVADVLGWMP